MPAKQTRDWIVVLLLVGFSLYLFNSVWRSWDLIPAFGDDPDGRQQLSFLVPIHDAVKNHGELPLWNPYFGGGVQWAGYIYAPGLSIVSIPYILFGALHGLKFWLLACLFLGGLGMYFAARWWLKLDRHFALFSAAAYMATQWLPARAMSGNYDESTLFTAPIALVLFYALVNRRWIGLLLPIYFQTLFAQAKYGPFIVGFVVLVFAVYWGIGSRRRMGFALALWFLSFTFGALMSLHKLLPLLDLMALDLVDQTQYGGMKSYDSWGALLLHAVGTPKDDRHREFSQVMGFGILVLLLAVLSLAMNLRRAAPWAVAALIGCLYTLGSRSAIDLAFYTTKLPFFRSMNSVAKYWNLPILMAAGALSGLGLQHIVYTMADKVKERHRPLAIIVLFAAGVFLTLDAPADWAKSVWGKTFPESLADLPPAEEFYQVSSLAVVGEVERYRHLPEADRTPQADQYHNIMRGIGTITWYGNFVYPENAEPRFFLSKGESEANPAYKGEVYTPRGTRKAREFRQTYNTKTFTVSSGEEETVIINQNYHKGWHATPGSVIDQNGLIAVNLPPGFSGTVNLSYHNPAFTRGLAISIIAIIVWFGAGIWFLRLELKLF